MYNVNPCFCAHGNMGLLYPWYVIIVPMYNAHPYFYLKNFGKNIRIIHSKNTVNTEPGTQDMLSVSYYHHLTIWLIKNSLDNIPAKWLSAWKLLVMENSLSQGESASSSSIWSAQISTFLMRQGSPWRPRWECSRWDPRVWCHSDSQSYCYTRDRQKESSSRSVGLAISV